MTEQQRKAIEILNSLREPMMLSEERALSEDDYFSLLSFIIEKPNEVYIPQPCPSIMPWPSPIQPYYGSRWEVTCKPEEDEEEFDIAIETLNEAGQHSSAIWLKSLKDKVLNLANSAKTCKE